MTAARPMTVDELCAWLESDDGPRGFDRPGLRAFLASNVRLALSDADEARRSVSAHNAKVRGMVAQLGTKVDAAIAARKAGQR